MPMHAPGHGETTFLNTLLGETPLEVFVQEHYLKLPWARPAGEHALLGDLGWTMVEQLLIAPGADVIVGREGTQWPGTDPPTPAKARELLQDGYTIGIRRAHRHSALLKDIGREFETAFAAPCDIHVYCTPAGHPGFGWHYDAEEVFVVQCQGAKDWWLRKNTVNPWPLVEAIPANQRYEREIMPTLQCRLQAGDWLYIPNGYWHRTHSGTTESISLSIGLRAPTALDIYDALRERLMNSMLWRQRLPCLGTAGANCEAASLPALQELFATLGADLAKTLSQPELVRSLLDQQDFAGTEEDASHKECS